MTTAYHLNKVFMTCPLVFGPVRVSQIGRMFCNDDTLVSEHRHEDLYELTVVTDGAGTVTVNGVPVTVKRGDIHITFPGDTHRIESDRRRPLRFDFFAFTTDSPLYAEALRALSAGNADPQKRLFRDERIPLLIGSAIAELNDEGFCADELLTSLFQTVLIYTLRGFSASGSIDATPHRSAELLCYRLMQYIDTHVYSMDTLDELSTVTDYSYGYLSSLFRKTTGCTLAGYYREKRLEAACTLLREDKLKISEIAEKLNYSSAYAFSKAFRNRCGLSPRAYREQLKQI